MALDKATLITNLQTAFNDGIGTDDEALGIATAIADAIDIYVKTGKATGLDAPSGDTHDLSIS